MVGVVGPVCVTDKHVSRMSMIDWRANLQAAGINVPPVAASMISSNAEKTPNIKIAQERTFLVGYLLTYRKLLRGCSRMGSQQAIHTKGPIKMDPKHWNAWLRPVRSPTRSNVRLGVPSRIDS